MLYYFEAKKSVLIHVSALATPASLSATTTDWCCMSKRTAGHTRGSLNVSITTTLVGLLGHLENVTELLSLVGLHRLLNMR
jgi:hypothetical protein